MLTVCIVEDQKADQDTLRSYFDKFAKECSEPQMLDRGVGQ
jgi:hypothetical protein